MEDYKNTLRTSSANWQTSWANWLSRELNKVKTAHGEKFCPFEVLDLAKNEHKDFFKRNEGYFEEKGIDIKKGIVKVAFEYIPRLVAHRDIVLFEGSGFLPLLNTEILLETFFKKNLEDLTKQAKKILPEIEENYEIFAEYLERIDNILADGKDYSKVSLQRQSKINLADLDIYAHKHFPLCMREMYRHLKQNHHLKHTGRMQFGLFLKGIGLTLDDSITFWRTEFTKKMNKEKFDKNYLYNIRHSYGKEGKRADYTPWSCSKIILEPSPGLFQFFKIHNCN